VDDWPDLLRVLERYAKPEREKSKNKEVRAFPWWKHWRPRPELNKAMAGLSNVLVTNCGAAPHLALCEIPAGMVYAHSLAVLTLRGRAPFSVLQSRIHEVWARSFSSSMKDDLRYTPSDCFENFPFPSGATTDAGLETAGQAYYDHRRELMIARNEGMTKTYNRFHDATEESSDIRRLRELQAEMDRSVLLSYSWKDLADSAEPIFLNDQIEDNHTYQGRLFWPAHFRDEVLARLLVLNAEQHAEEVRLGVVSESNRREFVDKDNEVEDEDAAE
jgi:hypothetical protein